MPAWYLFKGAFRCNRLAGRCDFFGLVNDTIAELDSYKEVKAVRGRSERGTS